MKINREDHIPKCEDLIRSYISTNSARLHITATLAIPRREIRSCVYNQDCDRCDSCSDDGDDDDVHVKMGLV